MSYLYHFKGKDLKGDILYSLNELKDIYPEIYADHVKKYDGREILLERSLPLLNCLWNDVIHLSPLNPQKVIDCWKELGVITKSIELEIFKVPISMLDEDNTIYFHPKIIRKGDYRFSDEQISPFRSEDYIEQESVSEKQISIWKEDIQQKRRVFWYSHTTHILYRGSINTQNLETFMIK